MTYKPQLPDCLQVSYFLWGFCAYKIKFVFSNQSVFCQFNIGPPKELRRIEEKFFLPNNHLVRQSCLPQLPAPPPPPSGLLSGFNTQQVGNNVIVTVTHVPQGQVLLFCIIYKPA